nr:serine carboxypeptidase S28 family protein [Tanacetum cinerariifolium]
MSRLQVKGSISEYYTKMKCVWEELDGINILPIITTVSPEFALFLAALSKQKEEQRLFQFLNGLDEHYDDIAEFAHDFAIDLATVPLMNPNFCFVDNPILIALRQAR